MAAQASPTPSSTQLPGQGADLASLQTQLVELRVQHAGLQAQYNRLKVQLDQMLRNNPARPGVQQQWADVGVQLATVEGNLAVTEARISEKQGRPIGTSSTQGRPPRGSFDPNMVVPAVTVVMLVLIAPVSVAWARRILRGEPKRAPMPSDLSMRLDRLEQAVDTIAIEVERVSEGQRFITKVLVDRPAQSPADDASASQQKPPLALGAGPMEPIVAPGRERVHQRIVTPH